MVCEATLLRVDIGRGFSCKFSVFTEADELAVLVGRGMLR